MNITYRVDKDIVYIEMEGRIDASNSSIVEEKILAIKEQNISKHFVIDLEVQKPPRKSTHKDFQHNVRL